MNEFKKLAEKFKLYELAQIQLNFIFIKDFFDNFLKGTISSKDFNLKYKTVQLIYKNYQSDVVYNNQLPPEQRKIKKEIVKYVDSMKPAIKRTLDMKAFW